MCSHLVSFSLFTSVFNSFYSTQSRAPFFMQAVCGAEDIGRHRLKTTYDDRFSTIQSCSRVADLGEGPGDPHHPFFMIIFQTIFSDISLLQTKQTCYLIETLGKSSTYSLLEGENPFLFGSAYSIYRRYLLWLQGGETRSVYLNDLIKKKTPVYPVSYHNRGFLTQFTVKEHSWVTVDAFQANWSVIHEGDYDPWPWFLRNIISSYCT